MTVQIGVWTDFVNTSDPNGSPLIYVIKDLKPGVNEISSNYGGNIYILTEAPKVNPVKLTFSGAIKTADFHLGTTDASDWYQELQNSDAPWFEIYSPNLILTLPTDKYLTSGPQDPTDMMNFWNDVLSTYFYKWTGLEKTAVNKDKAPSLPQRIVLDSRIFSANPSSGYPIELSNSENAIEKLAITDIKDAWDVFQLLGKNFNQKSWAWPGFGQSAALSYIIKAANEKSILLNDLNMNLSDQFRNGRQYAEQTGGKDFDGDQTNAMLKLTPLVQIFEKAVPATGIGDGYDFMTFLSKRNRSVANVPSSILDKHNFLYKALCDFTEQDWQLFFHAWGISLNSDTIQMEADKYPLLTTEVWKYNIIDKTGGTSTYNPYDPVNWTVIDWNSKAPYADNGKGGLPSLIIDGDPETFWHSNWKGNKADGDAKPPYHLTVDLGMALKVDSFYLIQRPGTDKNWNTRIHTVELSVSRDKNTWTDLKKFKGISVDDASTMPKVTLKLDNTKTFRYFKLTVNEEDIGHGTGNDVGLAEIGVYKSN